VDPIGNPKRVITEAELDRCRTIGDVASLTLERLKQTEVRFISSQRDKDAKILKGFRAHITELTAPKAIADSSTPAAATPPPQEIEMSSNLPPRRPGDPSSPTASFDEREVEAGRPDSFERRQVKPTQPSPEIRCCPCSWCVFGGFSFSYQRSGSEGYPRILSCVCFRFKLLSKTHLMLMIGCCCSIGVFVLETVYAKEMIVNVVGGTSAFYLCLVMLLVRFEQIDIIQKLEREVNELEGENDRIVERKAEMVKFWHSMQSLTDLWVHRTVPRLDLLAEVQGHLQDAPPEDVLALMAGANTRLEDLESHLPELSVWRHNDDPGADELTEESKKSFSERIERLCHEEKLPKILHGINKVIEEKILRIEGSGEPAAAMARLTQGSAT